MSHDESLKRTLDERRNERLEAHGSLAAPPGSSAGLDYEMHCTELEQEWQVWTPFYDGATGGILGTGKTKQEAKADAVRNMQWLCERLTRRRANTRI